MHSYTCFGLQVDSEVELPELTGGTAGTPDVVIRRGHVADPPADAVHLPFGLWRNAESCGVRIPEVAAYWADRGREIVVDVEPDADPHSVRTYLLGTMMGAVLMQRGRLVLHGNAFAVGDACAVVVGRSGAGKSTLAAELQDRGFTILADDTVPVDDLGRALPGYPRMKLWADALDRLGRTTTGLTRIRTVGDKFEVPIGLHTTQPHPVRWIFALDEHPGDLVISEITGMAVFDVLHENTYRRELIHDTTAAAEHLRQCAMLAGQVRVARVLRPSSRMSVEATADAILEHIGAVAASAVRPTSKETA